MSIPNSDTDSYSEAVSDDLLTPKHTRKLTTIECDTFSESSSNEEDEKYVFGISPMFSDCVQSITSETVFKVEFRIRNIDKKHTLFQKEIIHGCRESNLKGYIHFKNNQTEAIGIMEGAIKDINRMKKWVELASDYIEEPLQTNVFFSWFLIATEPCELEFDIQQRHPDYMESGLSGSSTSFRTFRAV